MKVIFLSGTYILAPEGKPEVRLGPGSNVMQPGPKKSGDECARIRDQRNSCTNGEPLLTLGTLGPSYPLHLEI